jgi:stage II sporulation protein D
MPSIIRYNFRYFILLFLALFFFAARPTEFGQEKSFFQGFLIEKPVIRVALGVNLEDIFIHASAGMKIYRVSDDYKLLSGDAPEVRIKGHREKLSEKFVVQVAQFRKKEDAELAARRLSSIANCRFFVEEDTEDRLEGVFGVRAGDFLTRGSALDFIRTLNTLGIKDAWIVRKEIAQPETKSLWILVNEELMNLKEGASLFFIPSNSQSFLSYKGKSYRGIMVLRGSRNGIVLINILNVEDYLKGVVPEELSPYDFGELEAQKAQAVAARTYALKNAGQFKDQGFDLYATTASQVYNGMSVEHPLSSRSVDETRGKVAVFQGQLINALYTSTCGGATEDSEAIFGGEPVPYLRSTDCVLEKEDVWTISGMPPLLSITVDGANVSPELGGLAALGICSIENDRSFFKGQAVFEEVAGWIEKALAVLGQKGGKLATGSGPMNHMSFAGLVIEAFHWNDRVQNLMEKIREEKLAESYRTASPEDRRALAYFIISGIFRSGPEISDPDRFLTRAEAAHYLAKVMSAYKDLHHQGYLKKLDKTSVEVIEGDEARQLELLSNAYLFERSGESVIPSSKLELSGGDILRWIESDGKIRLLELTNPPLSSALDATSPFHRWQVRMKREDLESRLNQFYPLGKLIDVVPEKRGESKRVTELSIIGQECQIKVTGFKIREVLNLRDNLFVVDRERDDDGRISYFIFSGKGWGHGVGLCQVGAFRMAQKGATFDEILKKYYRGIKIEKIY